MLECCMLGLEILPLLLWDFQMAQAPNHVRTTFLQSSGGLRGLYFPPSALAGFSLSTKVKAPPLPTLTTKAHPKRASALSPLTFPQCGKDLRVPDIPPVRPHRQQPTRLLCPWDSLGKKTGVGCHFLLQCMKVKSESDTSGVTSSERPFLPLLT